MIINKWIILIITIAVIVLLLVLFKANGGASIGMLGKTASVSVQ